MITLTLVHRLPNLPAQSWTFENEKLIRVGRSSDNDVILHSAVVSRHHIELKRRGCRWTLVNLSSNGTYLEDHAIIEVPVTDNMMIRLANSGPQIHIKTGITHFKNLPKPTQTTSGAII